MVELVVAVMEPNAVDGDIAGWLLGTSTGSGDGLVRQSYSVGCTLVVFSGCCVG